MSRDGKGSRSTILGPAITGIIGGLPFLILAAILLHKAKGKALLLMKRYNANIINPDSGFKGLSQDF